MFRCPVCAQLLCPRGSYSRREWQGGHLQSQAVLPDILTPSCVCILSPWKLGERRITLHPFTLAAGTAKVAPFDRPRLLLCGLTLWSRAAVSSRGMEELCAVPLSLRARTVCDGGTGEACVPGGLVPSMALPLSRKRSPYVCTKVRLRGLPKKTAPLCDHWLKFEFPCWWVGNRQMEAESRKVDQQMDGHFAGSDNAGFCSLW